MKEKGTYIYRTPFMEWITMEEKGAYTLNPIHGVDHYGREGDIYTVPHPQGGSEWKRRGHIYCTSSTGRISMEGGWEECRSQRWWLTTKKHSLMDTAGKGHI